MDSYEVSTPSGTIQATQGQCIQIDASRPPFCYVVNATCSVPAPTTAAPGVTDGAHNGSAWDYCRGARLVRLHASPGRSRLVERLNACPSRKLVQMPSSLRKLWSRALLQVLLSLSMSRTT